MELTMKLMRFTAAFEMSLPIRIKKEGKYFISHCPPLDVYSQGESRAIAKKNIEEAVRLFVIDCYERGTLEDVLKESGFILLKKPIPQRPKRKLEEIAVCLPFVIDQESVSCRA
jgi:predicted RNase H-like HicB family nuclease